MIKTKTIASLVCLVSLVLFSGCAAGNGAVTVVSNPVRIPANLLTPLQHPVIVEYPVTVSVLLITISRYEALVDKANDRFEEIIFIQDVISLEENK